MSVTDEQRKKMSEAATARWAERKAGNTAVMDEQEDKPKGVGVVTVERTADGEKIIREDASEMTYQAMAQDPWKGAIIEADWHYCLVAEPQAGLGLPSNLLKFRQMGYQIAPAPESVRKAWEDSRSFVMRIPERLYQERQDGYRAQAAINRGTGTTPHGEGMVKVEHKRDMKSRADLANG